MTVESSSFTEAPSDGRLRSSKVLYVTDIVKQRIKLGVYKSGTQLPSLRALSAELNLNLPLVQRAIRQLEREGILESQHGIGVKVLETADCRAASLMFGFVHPYGSYFSMSLQQSIENALDTRFNLCITKSSHNDPRRERQEIERLMQTGINGLLLWPVEADDNAAFLQEISARLPVVFVDRTLDDVRISSVVHDYTQAGHDILRFLYEKSLYRVLIAWDPAKISSFEQLKAGFQDEAQAWGAEDRLTFANFPVIQLVENGYRDDYELADQAFDWIAPQLASGDYDALYCSHSEFFAYVFSDRERVAAMDGIFGVTMRGQQSLPHFRPYYLLNIEEWQMDSPKMLETAVELLQDMTLSRTTRHSAIRVPVKRSVKPSHP